MYLLDSYVPLMFKGSSVDDEWRKVKERAEKANNNLTTSLSEKLIDLLFVGSTTQYERIDIWSLSF